MCCNDTLNLGCFAACACIALGDLIADTTGTWDFVYSYSGAGQSYSVSADFSEDDALFLPGELNENQTVLLRIFRPDGTLFTFGEADCFRFTIVPVKPKGLYTDCKTPAPLPDCDCAYQMQPNGIETEAPIYAFTLLPIGNCAEALQGYRIKLTRPNGQKSEIFAEKLDGYTFTYVAFELLEFGDFIFEVQPVSNKCTAQPFTYTFNNVI